MVVINYQDQLQSGTFEFAVHYLVDNELDLSIFDKYYKNDTTGQAAYDPAILLKIILFAYSKGITSSREIQWCCETNIVFKALSCDTTPHYTTIAAFVSSHGTEITDLFEQVLLICHKQGLLGNELFAIDGCKLPSNAAKEWSGTFKELEQKRKKLRKQIRHHIKEHKRLDSQDTRDEARVQRQAQAIETLKKAAKKVDKFLKTHSPRTGQGKNKTEVKSNITDNDSAKMTTSKGTIQGYNGIASVDKKHQIIIDAQVFGNGSEQHTLKPILEGIKARYKKLGMSTDIYADNAIVTADTGFSSKENNAYLENNKINAYIPDNRFRSRDITFTDQKEKYGKRPTQPKKHDVNIIPSSEFYFDAATKTCICPQGKTLSLKNERTDANGHQKIYFGGKLLDCRHCPIKAQCMRNPESADNRKRSGRQVSFIIEKNSMQDATDRMKAKIDDAYGRYIYSHRMHVVEPVFANICKNKRLDRFSLRGQEKVDGQWKLFSMIHNIEKLYKYGNLAV